MLRRTLEPSERGRRDDGTSVKVIRAPSSEWYPVIGRRASLLCVCQAEPCNATMFSMRAVDRDGGVARESTRYSIASAE